MPKGVYPRKPRARNPNVYVERICETCGSKFEAAVTEVAKGWGRFCNRTCADRGQSTRVEQTCLHCGTTFFALACRVAKGEALFCGMACTAAARTTPLADRLWSRGERHPQFGCLMWTGPLNAAGYGMIGLGGRGGRPVGPHRVAYELTYGASGMDGMMVCHKCDSMRPKGDITYRRCFEPTHLFLGTNTDNVRDMLAKGRGRWGANHPTPGPLPT